MLNKEDFVLAQVLGKDNPQVRALVAAAANPGMEAAIHEMLRSLARQRGWNPDDPPRFALPDGMPRSDFVIGTAMSGGVVGVEVGLSDVDLPSHVGIFGMTAVGKTTCVKLLLREFTGKGAPGSGLKRTFLVLDVHGEYRDLLPLYAPEDLIWMTADELGLNPFEVPRSEDGRRVMPPEKWINNIREMLRLFWLNEPSLNLLCEVLREEYERRGVLAGGDDYPSLSNMIEALQRLSPPRGSDRAKAKDKLLDRFESLRALLPGLDVQRSRDFRKLMDRSVILDLVDVKDIALPLLFTLIVMLLREVYRLEGEQGINRMMVMEEAHQFLGGQTDRRTADLKESVPSGVLRDLRKTGTAGLVVSQLIQDVAPAVRGNLGSVFCLRQGHRQGVREAGAALNLKPWQEEEIAKLPNRHAIARFSRHGEPVYLAVKDARALGLGVSPAPSHEDATERSRPILEAIPYVKRSEPPRAAAGAGGMSATAPAADGGGKGMDGPSANGEMSAGATATDGGLHPRERKVLARMAERPWELIQDRMDALGLDREGEGDARAKLEARGLIALTGTVGAKKLLFELTARGRAFAEERGLSVAKPEKGSIVHTSIVYYTEKSMVCHLPAIRFQRAGISATTGGVQSDSLAILPGGGRIPIQACFKNQPAYEADVLLRLHKLALLGLGDADKVDFVLAVCVNRRHKAAIERALQEKNGGRMPDRVVLLDFDTVVDPKFDWASVLELQI
jgi:hypothetical protein